MTFDELISNLDNINLNDDNEIIKIDKDKLFSKNLISKYESFKHNNMCLILYKEEKDYIKVAKIEFINVELSDIKFILKDINNFKKENINLKNRISELENINKQPLIFDELSTYFEYKNLISKFFIENNNNNYSIVKLIFYMKIINIFMYQSNQSILIFYITMIIYYLKKYIVFPEHWKYQYLIHFLITYIITKFIKPVLKLGTIFKKFNIFYETVEIIHFGNNLLLN